MRIHRRSMVFVLLLLLSVSSAMPARAIIFDYSYAFGSGWVASGTLEGHREGLYVVDVFPMGWRFIRWPGTMGRISGIRRLPPPSHSMNR
jgi:hypothetical protein